MLNPPEAGKISDFVVRISYFGFSNGGQAPDKDIPPANNVPGQEGQGGGFLRKNPQSQTAPDNDIPPIAIPMELESRTGEGRRDWGARQYTKDTLEKREGFC